METVAVPQVGGSLVIVAIQVLLGLVSLVCWIMVLIPIFKENVGLGILGIFCAIFTFIYGWVKVKEYGLQKVMLTWTIAFVAGIAVQIIAAVVVGASVAGQLEGM